MTTFSSLLRDTLTVKELEEFLKTEGSESTGFTKSDGSGESVGHESGRKIVDILKRNPDKVGHCSSFLSSSFSFLIDEVFQQMENIIGGNA
jgi:hypothetical protein